MSRPSVRWKTKFPEYVTGDGFNATLSADRSPPLWQSCYNYRVTLQRVMPSLTVAAA